MAELRRQNLKLVDQGHSPSEPHPAPAQASEVARLLRATRARAGIELQDASLHLKIQYPYLVALEEGHFNELPGPTYALGFVRAYAEFLELDADAVVRQFKEEGQGLARRTSLVFPEPIQEGRLPGGAALLIALVIAGLAYGGWYYYQSHNRVVIAAIPPVPPNLSAMPLAATPPPAGSQASEPPMRPEREDLAQSTPSRASPPSAAIAAAPQIATMTPHQTSAAQAAAAPQDASGANGALHANAAAAQAAAPVNLSGSAAGHASATQPALKAGKTAAISTPPAVAALPQPPDNPNAVKPREGHAFGEDDPASRVMLIARQDSWIQVRDREGNVVFRTTLHPGDSYKVPNKPGLIMYTNNAGGLVVTVDGRSAPSLGAVRAVRSKVSLDPEVLRASPSPTE